MKKYISLLVAMMVIVTGLGFGSVSAAPGGSNIGNGDGAACEAHRDNVRRAFERFIADPSPEAAERYNKQRQQFAKHCLRVRPIPRP